MMRGLSVPRGRRHRAAVAIMPAMAAVLLLCSARPRSSAEQPSRIISLIPAVTEMLFAIGAGSQVVGVSSFDEYPPEVKKLTRVGALLDPDLERILSLRPDLVIVYGSQTDLLAQLQRASIPVFVYRHAGLADVPATIRTLGDRVGRTADATALVQRIDDGLARIRQRVSGRPRPRTLLVFERDAGSVSGIYASGGVGFLDDMLRVAGGENVFGDVRRQSVQATSELILARRPEVVIELRPQPMTAAEISAQTAAWQSLPALPAVKQGRVVIIADQRPVVPGPRVVEGTELIARALHPEAFR